MRKVIIAAVLAVFVVYCYFAYLNQSLYTLPNYDRHELDITNGVDPASEEWKATKSDRLSELTNRRLQPVNDLVVSSDRTVKTHEEIEKSDFEALLAAGTKKIEVNDPTAIYHMAERGLHVRQDVKSASGEIVAKEGAKLDKAVIDACLAEGVKRVPVVGQGEVVGVNATVLMVIIIFIGLALALEEVFWKPVMKLADERNGEIVEGMACVRGNREEAHKLVEEEKDLLREVHKDYQKELRRARHETMREADKIVGEAWNEMKTMREAAGLELKGDLDKATEGLHKDLPAIVDAICSKMESTGEAKS